MSGLKYGVFFVYWMFVYIMRDRKCVSMTCTVQYDQKVPELSHFKIQVY